MKDLNKNKIGYKHTPVGWIPEDWEVKPLGNFISIKSGDSPANYTMGSTGSFLYLKVEDLNNSNKYQYLSRFYVEEGSNKIEKGSIIFPKRGAAILNNKVRILSKDSYMDSNLMSIKVNSDEVFNEFLYYYIIFVNLSKIADTSTIPQINNKHIEPYKFRKPSYTEQVNIANILCSWDKAIETTQNLIAAKERLKKGLMQQLLTGKKRLPGFNGEWIKCRLGDITKNFSRRNKSGIEAKVYSVTNYDGFVLQSEHFEREIAGDDLSNYKIIKKGEFAYNPARINVGSIAQFKEDIGIISSLYVCFSVCKELNDVFLRNFLELEQTKYYINSLGEGGVRVYLWYPLFSKIKIQLPPIEEQLAIANVLTVADKEIELLKSQLKFYKQQKKGLMQVLLTGAVRVKI
ncbi:MAG TPA: restriction endonuclease subunit S [Ignavibacteria bacterium]|nr:restriction endonuclease subunit S [Ignavibacteria bacterium]